MNRYPVAIGLSLLCVSMAASAPCMGAAATDRPAAGIHTIRADDGLLQLAKAGGFTWMIQLLEWREVEPAPGECFWEYIDWLVRATEYYGLDLVLRLDHPPEWAIAPDGVAPVDVAAYAAFAGRVVVRYRGRVTAYIVWNEPNLAIEWEGRLPDPVGYTGLLCAAHAAIRVADPQALVVSAGLAPTNHSDDLALHEHLAHRATDQSPVLAPILATIHAIQRPGLENLGVGGILRKRRDDRFSHSSTDQVPTAPCIGRAVQAVVLGAQVDRP